MASSSPLLMRILANSVTCATRAGLIIKETMKTGNLNTIEKGSNDPQTEADRNAQRCIINSLNKNFPNVAIIGEESLDERETPMRDEWIINDLDASVLSKVCPNEFANIKDEEIVIWVDPLDGTTDYTQGFLDYATVLIGIAVNGKAIAGVIHQPYHNYQSEKDERKVGRTVWGLVGLGAFGYDAVSRSNLANTTNPENLIITTTKSHFSDKVENILNILKPEKIIRAGGAGYKSLLVLEGVADCYFFPVAGCKRWDTCNGEAILRSVGGCLTDINGNKYEYAKDVMPHNVTGVVASRNETVHKWIIDTIPPDVKRSLSSQL